MISNPQNKDFHIDNILAKFQGCKTEGWLHSEYWEEQRMDETVEIEGMIDSNISRNCINVPKLSK